MRNKLLALILATLLLFPNLAITASALSGKSEQWYIKHSIDHNAPVCDARFSGIGEYCAYYLGPDNLPGDQSKKIYLTFDLGYVNDSVLKILDTLREKGVHAAFFILGHVARKDGDVLKRMIEDGHLICNHTSNHIDVSTASKEEFLGEIQALEGEYTKATGEKISMFFRPPEGKFSKQSLEWAKEAGYVTVFWSFAYYDWDNQKQPAKTWAIEKILKHAHAKEILLLHPTSSTNAEILGDVIDLLLKEGYDFGSLNDLILRTSDK